MAASMGTIPNTIMTGTPNKRQKREEYRKSQDNIQSGTQISLPKKKFYRQRAHANPFSDHNLTYPACPSEIDWSTHYPAFIDASDRKPAPVKQLIKPVEVADIGCGFGGLLVALSPLLPSTLMVGMELRTQVLDYIHSRVSALRSQNPGPKDNHPTQPPGLYQNISALRTNTMKFLPNYFCHQQLSKIFLCFPDPHFKQRKHKARIVSAQLNAEYAYVLRPGGMLYTITDVEELHQWMVKHFEGNEAGDSSELWERVGPEELEEDVCVKVMREETEEGKKVTRNHGKKFVAVWKRKEDPEWPD